MSYQQAKPSVATPWATALVLLALTPAACDTQPAGAPPADTGRATTTPAPTAPPQQSVAPSAVKPQSPHAGSWNGTYEAAKADVVAPKGVPYETWKSDDGKANSGDGAVELTVEPDGTISGQVSGALGDLMVRGVIEDDVLRCGLSPAKPGTAAGMQGVLVGQVKAGEIVSELRVSSMDAAIVRKAAVSLSRK